MSVSVPPRPSPFRRLALRVMDPPPAPVEDPRNVAKPRPWHATAQAGRRLDRRFRVAERRDLREAVRFGSLIGAAILAIDLVLNASREPALGPVNAIGIVALLLLFTPQARRRPHAAAFAVVVTLLVTSIAPELLNPVEASLMPGYLALIIIASALFLPWGRSWHAAWLLIATVASLGTAVISATSVDHAIEFSILILASSATSAAGNVLVRRRRVRVHLQQVALHDQRAQLRRLSAELREMASRDSLTGLSNRRRLNEDIDELEARLGRDVLPGIAAIMLDLDHFKTYNDRSGHPAGDEVLRVVSAAVRGAVREIDRVYRYGGEELLVLLEEPTREGALLAARRILDAVRRVALPHVAQPGRVVTMSAGAAAQTGSGVSVWHVIEAADKALYEAKRDGRDRAVLARPLASVSGERAGGRQLAGAIDPRSVIDPHIFQVPSA